MKDKMEMMSQILAKTGNKAEWGWFNDAVSSVSDWTSNAWDDTSSWATDAWDDVEDWTTGVTEKTHGTETREVEAWCSSMTSACLRSKI